MSVERPIEAATGRSRSIRADRPAARRRSRLGRTAAAVYVTAWLTGLLVAPLGPGFDATDAEIHSFHLEHRTGTLIQSILVHGVAGVAIGALTLAATRRGRARTTRWVGLAAAGLSLTQAGLGVAVAVVVSRVAPGRAAALVHAVTIVDVAKLILLAGFVLAAGSGIGSQLRNPGLMTRWSTVLAGLLVLGAAGLVVDQTVLRAALVASLPTLLGWAIGLGIVIDRPSRQNAGSAGTNAPRRPSQSMSRRCTSRYETTSRQPLS